jgi:adenosine deaminase
MDARLERFIRQMPKVELHLHLEGTVRPTTLMELARHHGVKLPVSNLDELAQWFHFRSFRHFLDIWLAVLGCLRTAADFARITRELGETAAAQRVRYLEAIFTPATHERYKGMTHDEVWAGIREGARSAQRDLDVQMRFIVDVPRNRRPGDDGTVEATVAWAIAHGDDGIVALGLGGSERDNPPELFTDLFRHAKAHGLRVYPHAGETEGPESIWGAIRALDADRIAHGVRAVDDPGLLAHLAGKGIACDVCPTSNVRLGVYPSLVEHPIRRLLAAGVRVTLNSDDPALFQTTLTDELLAVARTHGLTAAELATLVRTAVDVSFTTTDEKAALGARIDAEIEAAWQESGADEMRESPR